MSNVVSMGGKCPICGAKVTRRAGLLKLPVCLRGHHLIDKDGPPIHAIEWRSTGHG